MNQIQKLEITCFFTKMCRFILTTKITQIKKLFYKNVRAYNKTRIIAIWKKCQYNRNQKFSNNLTKNSYFTDVHRGVLLSFSTATKYEFCEDIFGAQLFIKDNQEPFRLRNKENKFGLLRHKISIQEDADAPAIHESLHAICGPFIEVKKRRPRNRRYDYSTAYRSKWFYITDNFFEDKLYETGYLRNFVTQSPDHVHFKQSSLEQRYMNTQKIISEHLFYVQGLGYTVKHFSHRCYLDKLSLVFLVWKLHLCLSILKILWIKKSNPLFVSLRIPLWGYRETPYGTEGNIANYDILCKFGKQKQ